MTLSGEQMLMGRPPSCPDISFSSCAQLFDRFVNFEPKTSHFFESSSFLFLEETVLQNLIVGQCLFPRLYNNLTISHSSSCAPGSWRLTIPPDSQKRFLYWSSDYKYRLNSFQTSCAWTETCFPKFSEEMTPTLSEWGKVASSLAGPGWVLMRISPYSNILIWQLWWEYPHKYSHQVSFDGEKIVLDAHHDDFWVVFAR